MDTMCYDSMYLSTTCPCAYEKYYQIPFEKSLNACLLMIKLFTNSTMTTFGYLEMNFC